MTVVYPEEERRLRSRLQPPAWLSQALRFVIVGLSNTFVDAGIYFMLTRWLPFFAALPASAKALSYFAGVLNSFYWNKNWTFRSSSAPASTRRTLLPFILVNLLGLGLNVLVLQLCLSWLGLHELLAFLFATGATLVWNFIASKLLVFHQ